MNMTIKDMKNLGMWPLSYMPVLKLVPYIKRLGSNLKVLEIGTGKGETAAYLLETLPQISSLVTIDPYKTYANWNGIVPEDELKIHREISEKNLEPYGDRVVRVYQKSKDVVDTFEDGSFDFIFVDGGDRTAVYTQDLISYYPKLRVGGVFSGNNYQMDTVREAIDAFQKESKVRIPLGRVEPFGWFWVKL